MKITPDQYPEFRFQECEIAGDKCWLITPGHINTEWTEENAWMRSAIIRQDDGFCVSQGFKKFTNWGEKPAFQPWIEKPAGAHRGQGWTIGNMSGPIEARHKLDGSCLIVSRYKGVTICRTRGSVDAEVSMANGHEIALFKKKYPRFFAQLEAEESHQYSYLFEWTSPANIIILREHQEPKLTYLACVCNHTKVYGHQCDADRSLPEFDRPTKYTYNSVAECIADVKAWVGKEGVVIYSQDGQTLKKIKGEAYLALHRLKGSLNLRRIDNVVDVFLQSPRSTQPAEFFAYIEGLLDFETADAIREMIEQVCVAYGRILADVGDVNGHVWELRNKTRKEAALEIVKSYPDYRKTMAFAVLDRKFELDDKFFRMAFEHHTK